MRIRCLSKGIVVAFTCAPVARNGRARPEREAARAVEDNPPRRTKYRGRTRETRASPDGDALYPAALCRETKAQVHREGREKERKRFIRRVEKSNASPKSRPLIPIGLREQIGFCIRREFCATFKFNLFQVSQQC